MEIYNEQCFDLLGGVAASAPTAAFGGAGGGAGKVGAAAAAPKVAPTAREPLKLKDGK